MSAKTKKKICWNCEGNVDVDKEVCTYCGVHVNNTPIPGTAPSKNSNLNSPFKCSSSNLSEKTLLKAPYPLKPQESPLEKEETNGETQKTSEEEPASDSLQPVLGSLLPLLLGCFLVIFGLILFFFSNSEGIFTLSWNGKYWYIYALLGLSLSYIGWHTLSKVPE